MVAVQYSASGKSTSCTVVVAINYARNVFPTVGPRKAASGAAEH